MTTSDTAKYLVPVVFTLVLVAFAGIASGAYKSFNRAVQERVQVERARTITPPPGALQANVTFTVTDGGQYTS